MTEKWIQSKLANVVPLIVFFTFITIYSIAGSVLSQCENSRPCSSISIQNHVLKEPQKTIDSQNQLIKSPVKNKDGVIEKDKDGNEIKDDIYSRQIMASRYGKQFLWTFFISINVFLGIIGLVLYFLIAYKSVPLKYVFIGLVISLIFGLFSAYFGASPVIHSVVSKLIDPGDGKIVGISVVGIVKFVNFVADTIAIATPFTLCAVLFRKPRRGSRKREGLLEQVEDLRLVLYVATILLIVGVLRMSAVLNWSLAFMEPDIANVVSSFFGNFTFVIGAAYTVLLAVIYIPVYYILKKRALLLIDESSSDESGILENFKLEFFTFSLKDSLPRIIAIVAPFLTGTISEELLTNFFSQ